MQESFLVKHSRLITIVSLSGIFLCVIVLIIVLIQREFSKPTLLSIQLAPSSAVLSLNEINTEFRTGTYEILPGTYTGIISARGFKPKTIEFTVKPRQTSTINDYLIHAKEGLDYFNKSAANISILRTIKNDPEINTFLEAYDHKASIYDKLPIYITWLKRPDDYPTYTLKITDGRNHQKCQGTLCLLATGPRENNKKLQEEIQLQGYNIEDYEVIYEKSY